MQFTTAIRNVLIRGAPASLTNRLVVLSFKPEMTVGEATIDLDSLLAKEMVEP